jgi:hypothetical protein
LSCYANPSDSSISSRVHDINAGCIPHMVGYGLAKKRRGVSKRTVSEINLLVT